MKYKYRWDTKTQYLIPPDGLNKQQIFYWRIKFDKKWYIQNFLKIRDKNAELVPFIFNKAQILAYEKYLVCLRDSIHPRFIFLKSRQQGISTWTEAMIFADTVSNKFKNSFIVAHEQAASSNLFNMSKLYYDELPKIIQPMISRSNEKALVFEDKTSDDGGLRSKFTIGTANNTEGGRGNTFHNLHMSEVAFFPQAEKTCTAILQAVPDTMGTMVIYESTANGIGGYFYEQWQLAKAGRSGFIPIFLPWSFDPTCTRSFKTKEDKAAFIDRVEQIFTDHRGDPIRTYEFDLKKKYKLTYEQLNWRDWAINNKCGGNVDMFKQEYPINDIEAFLSSGRPVFPVSNLRKYENATKDGVKGYLDTSMKRITWRPDDKGYITVWKPPVKGEFYVLGGDVAEGLETGDFSCMYVMDSKFNIVATWHGHIDPDLLGLEAVKLARFYNDAYIGIENNNHGLTTLRSIQRYEYWNLYFTKSIDKITDQISTKVGWSTKKDTKPHMINKLREFIREEYISIPDSELVKELYSYIIEPNGSTNAQLGCHDDRVMACAITLQMALEGRSQSYQPENSDCGVKYDEDNKSKIEVSV
jgi:hypothetical protein